jgi:DNA-binding transcriptional regulator YiaG
MTEKRPETKPSHPTGQFIDDPITKLHYMQAIRAASGWTQQDVANHLGIQQSLVSRWENKTQRPDFANGYRLMLLLDELQHALLECAP